MCMHMVLPGDVPVFLHLPQPCQLLYRQGRRMAVQLLEYSKKAQGLLCTVLSFACATICASSEQHPKPLARFRSFTSISFEAQPYSNQACQKVATTACCARPQHETPLSSLVICVQSSILGKFHVICRFFHFGEAYGKASKKSNFVSHPCLVLHCYGPH
jgi:hypothetical protein